MFDTADVLVYIHPVISQFLIKRFFIVTSIGITKEIPRGIDECIHGIDFTTSFATTLRTSGFYEVFRCSQRWNSTCIKGYIFRQTNRQFFFRHELFTAFIAVYNRNWHAPITLTGNQPITQTIVNHLTAYAAFFQVFDNSFACFRRRHTVIFFGIDKDTVFMSFRLPFVKS